MPMLSDVYICCISPLNKCNYSKKDTKEISELHVTVCCLTNMQLKIDSDILSHLIVSLRLPFPLFDDEKM